MGASEAGGLAAPDVVLDGDLSTVADLQELGRAVAAGVLGVGEEDMVPQALRDFNCSPVSPARGRAGDAPVTPALARCVGVSWDTGFLTPPLCRGGDGV